MCTPNAFAPAKKVGIAFVSMSWSTDAASDGFSASCFATSSATA
ncbi:hypothetical protein [Agromyces sp. CCNWLW203]